MSPNLVFRGTDSHPLPNIEAQPLHRSLGKFCIFRRRCRQKCTDTVVVLEVPVLYPCSCMKDLREGYHLRYNCRAISVGCRALEYTQARQVLFDQGVCGW